MTKFGAGSNILRVLVFFRLKYSYNILKFCYLYNKKQNIYVYKNCIIKIFFILILQILKNLIIFLALSPIFQIQSQIPNIRNFEKYVKKLHSPDSFFFFPVTNDEILKLFKTLNHSKSTGDFSIPKQTDQFHFYLILTRSLKN